MVGIHGADPSKEESVARHRVKYPCAAKGESVDGAQRREHNRGGHNDRAGGPNDGLHQCRADAVLRGLLNLSQRQRDDVGEVGQEK